MSKSSWLAGRGAWNRIVCVMAGMGRHRPPPPASSYVGRNWEIPAVSSNCNLPGPSRSSARDGGWRMWKWWIKYWFRAPYLWLARAPGSTHSNFASSTRLKFFICFVRLFSLSLSLGLLPSVCCVCALPSSSSGSETPHAYSISIRLWQPQPCWKSSSVYIGRERVSQMHQKRAMDTGDARSKWFTDTTATAFYQWWWAKLQVFI